MDPKKELTVNNLEITTEKYDEPTQRKKSDGWKFRVYNSELLTTSNVWFISGHSGSGKTSLASELAKRFGRERFELDWFESFDDGFTDTRNPGYIVLKDFYKARNLTPEIVKNTYDHAYDKLLVDLIQYAMIHPVYKGKKIIIEGLQFIAKFYLISKIRNGDLYINYPVIILDVSDEQAMSNAYYRPSNGKLSWSEFVKARRNMYRNWESAYRRFLELVKRERLIHITRFYRTSASLDFFIADLSV